MDDSRLEQLADLIYRWNPRINLTGFKTRREILEILIGESVLALAAVEVSGRSVLDFGSGAGIPGLVWLACVPDMRLTSLESRLKKVNFQKEAARELGLAAEVLHGRFPDAVAGRAFDVVVSRAIRFDETLWGQGERLLSPNGCFIRFAGAGATATGWEAIPVSQRTTVLRRTKPRAMPARCST